LTTNSVCVLYSFLLCVDNTATADAGYGNSTMCGGGTVLNVNALNIFSPIRKTSRWNL